MTYLDHAATTPVDPRVVELVAEVMGRVGNPSSLHGAGRAARRIVEDAREQLAAALGVRPSEVVFTASGTEADNLAVKGLYWARTTAEPARRRIITSAIEHHAVLDPLAWLAAHEQAEAVLVGVDAHGVLDLDALEEAISADPGSVGLISVQWVNNEVGAIQPIADVLTLAERHGIPVHTDAVQAIGEVPFDFTGLAAASVSGHKLGGPVGVGALLVRHGLSLVPVLHGGGHERGLRSGTLNAAGIAGFALAVELAVADQARRDRVRALRDDLVARVQTIAPDAVVNSPAAGAPHIASISFPGCAGDLIAMQLDAAGVFVSNGSACQAGVPETSHVLLAMGQPDALARGVVRFSLGATSTPEDLDALTAALPDAVAAARRAGVGA